MIKSLTYLIVCTLFFITLESYAQGTLLLREPTLNGDEVTFVYANDLWKASINGGSAIRLTSNEGYETVPHYSPDGKHIAFSAQYNGNFDVYVIPVEGGEPRQLTWHPVGDFVTGWTPEGEILFRSSREDRPTQTNKFYTISMEGGLPNALDIPRAAYGEISPDGSHIAYTPITSWDPEWRNYRGGQAMPIWIVDLTTKELTRTPQPTQERHLDPVWMGDKIFYISERDYAANIWSFDPATGIEKQHTFHKQFDVKSLDADNDAIVYEQGGRLHLLNSDTDETRKLEISVSGDMNFARPRWEGLSANNLTNPFISPNGKRVLFESRGEVISIPKEHGTWRNLSQSTGTAERAPAWSPKGDKIAWFSDESGDYQLIIADQKGEKQKTISFAEPTFYFEPEWSPDGKFLAFSDTHYNIHIVNVVSGAQSIIDTDTYAHPNRTMNPVWSPDSKWIAYPKQMNNHFKVIMAHNVMTRKKVKMTNEMADAISPVWDENGKYLYCLASTNYGLNSGWLDMSSYDPDVDRSLYAVVLSASEKAPTVPKSDEEEVKNADNGDKEEKDKKDEEDDKSVEVIIDQDGIQDRIVALDLDEGNYSALVKGPKGHVFVLKADEDGNTQTVLKYEVDKMKSEDYVSGVRGAYANFDGSKILIQKSVSWILSSSDSKPNMEEDVLKTNVKIKVDPQAEYHQIFREGWRYMRDFLYVDNVHGAPWEKVYEWYSPWIDHVRHRTDLNYVVDIMSGEVAIGHSYVSGGDNPDLDRVPIGLLGCDFLISNGRYQISTVYTGGDWNPRVEAPLDIPGLEVTEGDFIMSINGRLLSSEDNIYKYLEQTSGRETTLTVADDARGLNSRDILVKPVSSERQLRSIDWVEANRRRVDVLSKGKLAYVYVPNTGGPGFTSFNRYYFAQQDKKGVIIDERNNGGGSAADYMIDIMSREIFGYFNSKAGNNRPWTTPIAGIWGPKVMLINERAGSGGDLLPYMFHAKELGPLVGTKTWGGLVGTWDTPRFIDGGRMVAPRGGFYDKDGNWAVEGVGISPDIEVIQHPKLVLKGHDPQLERGVKEALLLLEENEFEMKPEPAAPIRWKRPEGFKIEEN